MLAVICMTGADTRRWREKNNFSFLVKTGQKTATGSIAPHLQFGLQLQDSAIVGVLPEGCLSLRYEKTADNSIRCFQLKIVCWRNPYARNSHAATFLILAKHFCKILTTYTCLLAVPARRNPAAV